MAGQTTSSKALIYLSERVEDATEAVKGLIGGTGSSKYLESLDERTSVIRSQLESDRDDLRLEGLRTIVALLSKGRDASSHFPQVLKLTSNSNLEIRKLVYIIVRRYAKRQPDVALLGINSFQRDLLDRSEVVRAMALRVLSGLRLSLVASVVEVAISKCVKDPHFYVRKGAALAIVKCHQLSADIRPVLKNHLSTLLNDRHPSVLSAALVAHSAICPLDIQLLHPHYRKLCHALSDMDEWGQRNAIEALGLYARRSFAKPSAGEKLDADLELLFAKVEDLLMSRNPAVVTAAVRLIFCLAPTSYHKSIARPLVRLTNSTSDISYFALVNCYLLAQSSPLLLSPHVGSFLLRSSFNEPSYISKLKLKILVQLSDSSSWEMVLSELSEQAQFNTSKEVAQTAAEQLGTLANKDGSKSQKCIKELLKLLKECNDRDEVVGTAVSVMRRLLQNQASRDIAVVVSRLSALLFSPQSKKSSTKTSKLVGKGTVKSGLARGCIYWLLGQHCRLEVDVKRKGNLESGNELGKSQSMTLAQAIGTDVLRRAASNFAKEESFAKLQIILLSTKLHIFLPTLAFEKIKVLELLHSYILQLARYDEDFDVRDRGRFCKALTDRVGAGLIEGEKLSGQNEKDGAQQLGGVILRRNQVLHILFEGKVNSGLDLEEVEKRQTQTLDSLSFALDRGKILRGKDRDFCFVPWAEGSDLPPSSLREPAMPASAGSAIPSTLLNINSQRSFSSESLNTSKSDAIQATIPFEKASAHNSGTSTPKYKDLDAFLEEQSEEEIIQEDEDDTEEEEEEEEIEEEDDEKVSYSSEEESEEAEEEEIETEDETEDEEETVLLRPAPALVEENEWAR